MTEEEFKELTESLETVGHYVPTVRDMFQFLVDRKGYFRAGRFEAAIREILCSKTMMDGTVISQYEDLAKGFGLELQLTSTDWSAQFVITLPAEELIAEYEKYEALINKL